MRTPVNTRQQLHKAGRRARQAAWGLVLGLALLLGGLHTAAFADSKAGKALYTSKGCPACHGPSGNTSLVPTYPKLAGQNAPYMVEQLKAFKSQQRKSGQAALMWGQAAQLSEAEMKTISAWLAGLKK